MTELDRRNREATHARPTKTPRTGIGLQRFARHGGPDLTDLRGWVVRLPRGGHGSATGRGARGRIQKQQRPRTRSSQNNTSTSRSETSGPYDAAFRQHLINHKVWPLGYYLETGRRPPAPDKMQAIIAFLNGGRSSLEPETFTEDHFSAFLKAHDLATSEEPRCRTLESVEGPELSLSSAHVKRGPVQFNRLRPLLPDNLVPGFPDRVYGSRPENLHATVAEHPDLAPLNLPTAAQDLACPNLIVHVEGPYGTQETANVQAVYDGALAARGMEALWRFDCSHEDSSANEQHIARTLTCTFAAGILRIHAVHVRPGTGSLDSLRNAEYITTLLGVWVMDLNLEDFRRGAAAYRNAIKWARIQREEIVRFANRRA